MATQTTDITILGLAGNVVKTSLVASNRLVSVIDDGSAILENASGYYRERSDDWVEGARIEHQAAMAEKRKLLLDAE